MEDEGAGTSKHQHLSNCECVCVCSGSLGSLAWAPGGCQEEEEDRTQQDLERGERSGSPQGKGKNPPKVVDFKSNSNFMQIYSNYYELILPRFPVPVAKSHHADHV